MINLLEKELRINNIECIDCNNIKYKGKTIALRKCINILEKSAKGNKRILYRLWMNIVKELNKKETGTSCPMTTLLFIPAVKSLYNLAQQFDILNSNGVTNALKETVNQDHAMFSGKVMSNIVEYRLAIEWTHHLIRKDLYICALVKKYEQLMRKDIVVARGVAGPWSRVDIPMLERVFEWDDIAEEVAGREKDKRQQRRYRMGLEQYGEGDSSPNEGFYWREIRNEPYLFDSTEDSTYPHRNLLWV